MTETNSLYNKTPFKYSDRLYDVVLIRSVAIILVVAFHAYYMMMAQSHFPQSREMYYHLYYNINCLILKFRMPLFVFISGYLFSYLEGGGKYQTLRGLFVNKFRRLIIPYFVFATLMMLSVNDFSPKAYLSLSYSHLWFIPMLFWCFIFTRLQSFAPCSRKWWWILLITIIFICGRISGVDYPRILGLHTFVRWYIWFFMGYHILHYRDIVYCFIDKHRYAATLLLFLLFCVGSYYKCVYIVDDGKNDIITMISDTSIVILIWYLTNLLINNSQTDWVKSPVLFRLNKYSYGIFVFHNWIQPFMISNTAKRLFGLEYLAEKHVIIFPFMFFVSSFFISLAITYLLLKTRVGRFLVG